MIRLKTSISLLAVATIATLSIMSFYSLVSGQNTSFIYKGVVTHDKCDLTLIIYSKRPSKTKLSENKHSQDSQNSLRNRQVKQIDKN